MMKKGQVVIYGFMIMIVVIILALAFSGPLKSFNDTLRTNLNCDTPSDDYIHSVCIATDIGWPVYLGILVFMGGVVLTAKYILT